MFQRNTVFVIGAGANWHYGYPTGEQLVSDVIDCTKRVETYFTNRRKTAINLHEPPKILSEVEGNFQSGQPQAYWDAGIDLCNDLINRLESTSPLVIDYFLRWKPHLEKLGRAMIAFALLEREAHGAGQVNYNRYLDDVPHKGAEHNFPYNTLKKDNWVRFIVHQLLTSKKDEELSLLGNNVHFVTFNYDLSLERLLSKSLNAANFLEKEDVRNFLGPSRVIHMYGALNSVSISRDDIAALVAPDPGQVLGPMLAANRVLDACYCASNSLRVIDPHTKDLGPECRSACELLDNAERVYFLGFGFDSNNLERLGYPSTTRRAQQIFFTNKDNAMTVNKQFAATFSLGSFYRPDEWRGSGLKAAAEKSTRDCYQAIALDFGLLE